MLHSRYFVVDIFSIPSDSLSKAVIAIRSLIAPVQTHRWRRFIHGCRFLSSVAEACPHFRSRIFRPYLSPHLSLPERVEQLTAHYRLALEAGCGNLIRKTSVQSMIVADFCGRSGVRYQLSLASADRQRGEGEWVLRLRTGGFCVYTAAFSLVEEEGAPALKLGSLFGLLATDKLLTIKSVTRDLNGCKPRDLMVTVLCAMAAQLGCRHLILSGNRNKLVPPERYVCRKSSNYDQLWKEMGARPRDDGDFELDSNIFLSALPPVLPANSPKKALLLSDLLQQTEQFLQAETGTDKTA